jgi:hypothetical protein
MLFLTQLTLAGFHPIKRTGLRGPSGAWSAFTPPGRYHRQIQPVSRRPLMWTRAFGMHLRVDHHRMAETSKGI